jgi:alkylated DNA repair protein (DNA oxidative demethylase)
MNNSIVAELTIDQQKHILNLTRQVVLHAALYTAQMPTGQPFRYQQTGAGWGWTSGYGGGYRYQRHHPITGNLLPEIPKELLEFAKSYGLQADSLLINYYRQGSKLGLHQDKDEQDLTHPVLSVSLGDTATFLLGGKNRSDTVNKIKLVSGTVMMLQGTTRLAWHGVECIHNGTGPSGLLKGDGRLNLTFRKSQ